MVVRVHSCLMSRIRMIYDAYIIAKKYEKNPKLVILWTREVCCNIRYFDVFDTEQFSDIELKIIEVNKNGYWETKNIYKLIKNAKIGRAFSEVVHRIYFKILFKYYSKGCGVVQFNDAPEVMNSGFSEYNQWKEGKWAQILKMCEEHRNIYIDGYESFIIPRDVSGICNVIRFKTEYISVADKIINRDMVGVHIRRTDHKLAKELSPVELFVQKIDDEINKNNSIMFFLSTDDQKVENELILKYGKRIVTQKNKAWGRVSKEEMISGIIDCLCLSKCKKIYGSISSQFSGFAAEYGNIPIEIVKK